jgi:hypothetical protein
MRLPAHQPSILQLSLLVASAQANAAAGRASPTFHFEHNLLFANAKAYTTAGRASLTFHFEHNLLLFANAKAYTTAGRASPTFRFATQSTTFRSSPVLKCMRPLAELASTLSTPHYGTFVQPIRAYTTNHHSSSTSANPTPVLKIVNVSGDRINK